MGEVNKPGVIVDLNTILCSTTRKLKIGEQIYQKVISVQEARARYNLSTSALYKYVRFYRNGILPNKIKTSVVGLTSEEEEIFIHHLAEKGQSLDRLSNEEIFEKSRKYVGITKGEILKHTLKVSKTARVLRKRG